MNGEKHDLENTLSIGDTLSALGGVSRKVLAEYDACHATELALALAYSTACSTATSSPSTVSSTATTASRYEASTTIHTGLWPRLNWASS